MTVPFDLNQGETIEVAYSARGGTMQLKLVVPTTAERWRLAHAAKLAGTNPRYDRMLKEIAQTWWVGFSGATDKDGAPLQDTEVNRYRLLMASQKLTNFVVDALTAEEDKAAEGKDDSASD